MDLVITVDTDKASAARVVRLGASRITYPLLPQVLDAVRKEVASGARRIALDLSAVSYIDSATIGCIMDLYRLLTDQGGRLHISAPQSRVETMLSMAGVHKVVPVFREEDEALAAFGPAEGAR